MSKEAPERKGSSELINISFHEAKAAIERNQAVLYQGDHNHRTLRHHTAEVGRIDFAIYLTNQGSIDNAIDDTRRTLLHWTAT